MEAGGASPGGPRQSSAKKRRLAALEQHRGGAGAAAAAAGTGTGTALARSPSTDKVLPRPGSSASLRQASSGSGAGRSACGGKRRASAGSSGGALAASSGSAGGEQPPAREPPYDRLHEAIATGPAAEAMQLPCPDSDSQVVSSLLEQLMATNPRAFDARAAIGLKVQDRTVMLDNPVGQQQQQQQRKQGWQAQAHAQRHGKWVAQLAGGRQLRQLELGGLEEAGLTYESVQPLYRSWQQYMQELLPPGGADLEARLYAADLHGCLIRVAHTADLRYRRLRGIVVRETQSTLQLVTPDSRLVVVPKKLCTWEFDAGRRRVVTLLGPGLAQRGNGAGIGGGIGGIGSSAGRPGSLREAIRGQQRK